MGRKIEYFYLLLFALIIFGIFGYGIGKIYGMSLYPDEFGYWANAAQAVGYDWREAVSLGSYYSYGYSLLLFPILKLSRDGVTAYRIAIAMNTLMQAGAVFPAWGIYRRLFPELEKDHTAMAAGLSALYPVWTLYTQMTLTESLLCFLYLLGCYLLIRYLREGGSAFLIASAILYVYMYMVHMRTIGTLAAYMITVIILSAVSGRWMKRRGVLYVVLLLAAAGIAFVALGKAYVSGSVYALGDAGKLAGNSYGGKLHLIVQVLTGERTASFLLSCAGKLYYLLMASFGMLIPTIRFLFRQMKEMGSAICHKVQPFWQSFFSLFVLLSFLGQFAVAALFTSGGGRLDTVFYGRYNEYLIPLMIGIGALELLRSGGFRKILLWEGTAAGVLFGLTYHALQICGADVIQGDFAAGLNYITNDGNYIVEIDFVKSFLFSMALAGLVTACLYVARKKGCIGAIAAIIGMLEVCLAFLLSGKYTYRYNEVNYADIQLCERLTEEENPVVFYYEEGDYQYIDLIQFTLRENPVHVIRNDEASEIHADAVRERVGTGGYLLVRLDSPAEEELGKEFSQVEESGHFVLLRAD